MNSVFFQALQSVKGFFVYALYNLITTVPAAFKVAFDQEILMQILKSGFRIATVAKACLLLNRYFLIIFRRYADARKNVRKLRRTLRADPNALILAFDLEVYEHDHSIILEIGYAMTTLNNPKKMQTFHYIIKENLRYVRSWNC